ncbi:MAG: hypothetical protein Q9216_002551 [Gyalolechia sp. 2 TL-2023]
MTAISPSQEAGGFLPPTLPSPPPSTVNSPAPATSILPAPRTRPLRPGSSKENDFINYIEQKLLAISRHYENRFTSALSGEENPDIEGRGYKGLGEHLRDLNPVVDFVWISGTPSLQITFLLTIALTVTTSLQSFPFTPQPTFQFLRKLDLAFSSLLKGVNVATGERLPGFEGGRGKLSTTEKVRMRGIVERTRLAVVEVAGKDGSLADVKNVPWSESDTEDDFNMTEDDDTILEDETSHRRWEMDIARVYEKTIVELGMALDASSLELDKTITPAPLNTLCKDSLLNADRAIRQFEDDAQDGTLPETPLCSDENECRLGYLGERQDMPFLMVHAKPTYLSHQPPGTVSKAKRKPPPLRLPAVNGDSSNPDSPLSDFTSSPLTPTSALGAIGSQDVHSFDKKQACYRPKGSSIRQLDGTGGAKEYLLPAHLQRHEQTLTASPEAVVESTTNPANELGLAGTYSDGKESLGDRPSKSQQPQALCLRVLPTAKSFLRPSEPEAAWKYNDIKIDVYLNGNLCVSSYVSQRAYHAERQTQDTCSGARIGRLIEKPWVLMPPILDILEDSATPKELKQIEADVNRRWKAISNALNVAAELQGRNSRNELPVIGQYLQSLATIPMPATLPGMLNVDHKRFSIIDVLITSGKGNKDPVQAPYLMRPLSLKLHGYRVKLESSAVKEKESLEKKQPVAGVSTSQPEKSSADAQIKEQGNPEKKQPVARELSTRPKKSFADQRTALQPSSFFHAPRNSAGKSKIEYSSNERDNTKSPEDPSIYQAARKGILFQRSMPGSIITPHTPETEQALPSGTLISAPKRLPQIRKAAQSFQESQPHGSRSQPALNPRKHTLTPQVAKNEELQTPQGSIVPTSSKDNPPKRRRIQYYDVIDTRQTKAEEMEDIARQAADKDAILFTGRRITRSKLANTPDYLDMTEYSVAQEPVSKFNDSQAKLPNSTLEHDLTSLPKSNKYQDAMGVTCPPPSASQNLRKSEPPAPSRRRQDGSSPPAPAKRAEPSSSPPGKPLLLRHDRSPTGISKPPSANQSALPSSETPEKDLLLPTLAPITPEPGGVVKPPPSAKKRFLGHVNKPTPLNPTTWQIPPLSKDSIVTYPADGTERQIRAERGGWFREQEVLVGVRFVVG